MAGAPDQRWRLADAALARATKIVRMQTLNVRDILYVLTGGGNTLALMRDDGVVLVDTKPPGWGTVHSRQHRGRHATSR